MDRKELFSSVKRIVIKVGSAVIADEKDLNLDVLRSLCNQIAKLKKEKRLLVTIVSSGAVAAGSAKLKDIVSTIKSVPEKQALAAVGQGRLMQAYEEAFDKFNIHVAQILLTRTGLISRHRYVNAKNTVQTLLNWGIIPIVNENDTVSTEELQFTDNDTLAVLVLNLMDADLLICLSDIDCLYDKDPRKFKDAAPVRVVERVDDKILNMAGEGPGRAGRGGMKSKLLAARTATSCGVPVIIAKGREENVIERLFEGEELGTLFLPREKRLYGRKPWIALALSREGKLYLDAGAVNAILKRGKSLLPVGIKKIEGDFDAGDCVVCMSPDNKEIAVGITNYNSKELLKICGCHSRQIYEKIGYNGDAEVIHRDNMVVFE